MTARAFDAQRLSLRAIGAALARRWAGAQDQRALVDDLEGEGWLVVVRLGMDHPRLRWEVRNAAMNYLARALYGVVRSKSRARGSVILSPVSNLPLATNEMDPLRRLVFKEDVARRLAPPHCATCPAPVARRGVRCRPCAARRRYDAHPSNLLRGRSSSRPGSNPASPTEQVSPSSIQRMPNDV